MAIRYPLRESVAELDRLRRQHETWREPTEALWRLAAFGTGQTILDLGCGPGLTSRDLAAIVGPSGRVVAVDASRAATDALREAVDRSELSNVDVVTGDVSGVDLSFCAPHGVFARWLFCYLPDPLGVLKHVARHLRPGGTIALLDYWNYLAIRTEPASPLFSAVYSAVYDSFRDAGGSLDVAGALPGHLVSAGFSVQHIEPVCAVGRPGSPVWRWLAEFQELYLPVLIERAYLTRGVVDEYAAWWSGLETTDGGFLFAPPMLSIVAAKAPSAPARYP